MIQFFIRDVATQEFIVPITQMPSYRISMLPLMQAGIYEAVICGDGHNIEIASAVKVWKEGDTDLPSPNDSLAEAIKTKLSLLLEEHGVRKGHIDRLLLDDYCRDIKALKTISGQ